MTVITTTQTKAPKLLFVDDDASILSQFRLAFDEEYDPKVLRAALRYGYTVDTERVGRGVRFLARRRLPLQVGCLL